MTPDAHFAALVLYIAFCVPILAYTAWAWVSQAAEKRRGGEGE